MRSNIAKSCELPFSRSGNRAGRSRIPKRAPSMPTPSRRSRRRPTRTWPRTIPSPSSPHMSRSPSLTPQPDGRSIPVKIPLVPTWPAWPFQIGLWSEAKPLVRLAKAFQSEVRRASRRLDCKSEAASHSTKSILLQTGRQFKQRRRWILLALVSHERASPVLESRVTDLRRRRACLAQSSLRG